MANSEDIEVSPEDFPQYAADQISALVLETARARGVEKAFRHILHALIATHPSPAALKAMLSESVPLLIDSVTENEKMNSRLGHAVMLSMTNELARINELVEEMARQSGE